VSLCAGIGALDLAFHRAGIPTVAAVEKDDHARGVLADRFPGVTLFTDVKDVSADDLRAAGVVPDRCVALAGWPCQGNSVAGHRRGLADPRTAVWLHVARLLAELRPAWFVGENVPGLLSVPNKTGRDFARVLADLADVGMECAWRVLDARHFGVPQRRRRVVLIGHPRTARGAAVRLLFEPESRRRDLAPRRAPRPDTAATAGARVAPARGATHRAVYAGQCHSGESVGGLSTLRTGTTVSSGVPFVATVTGADHAHTLTAEGHDAGEDGIGRGVPVIGFAWQAGGDSTASGALEHDSTPTLPRSQTLAVAYAPEAAHSLMSHGGNDKQDPSMVTYIAEHAATLTSSRRGVPDAAGAAGGHLTARTGPAAGLVVRRLTPTECERLQGLPDGWTATSNGRPQRDSRRYQQLGNAVAVPVFEWAAHRLAAIDAELHRDLSPTATPDTTPSADREDHAA
jgi:DNA (cytosine-5)-methyltransferase 1